MKIEKNSYVLGILTIIGLISFAGIAFADSEIGDRIVALWYHGNVSNTTGYLYSNLTGIPGNLSLVPIGIGYDNQLVGWNTSINMQEYKNITNDGNITITNTKNEIKFGLNTNNFTTNNTTNNFTANQTFSEGINVKTVNLTGTPHIWVQNITNGDLFSPNVATRVKFMNVIIDNYGAWNGVDTFTVPITGYYSISSAVRLFNTTNPGTDYVENVYVNGIVRTRLWANNYSKVFSGGIGSGSYTSNFTIGDTIQIYTYSNEYYHVFGDASNKYTTLEIIKIG